MEKVYYTDIEIPLGTVWAATTEKGLIRVHALGSRESFMDDLGDKVEGELIEDPSRFTELRRMLERWSVGDPVDFDLPFDLRGTRFQKVVWRAIHRIPYGKLSSYGRLAQHIGRPRAARAVGNAVGANPCGIVIPCHRVIWSNGGLGGFGGGYEAERLNVKRSFLVVEGVLPRVEGEPEREVDLTRLFV
ncbi:MAG: methylated-DNA--[protein]-cysteine S-methyltransferase [Candidatus Bathyarchaeota archaeon]|jgi:O-6-methylguanine DNA methyltransferase